MKKLLFLLLLPVLSHAQPTDSVNRVPMYYGGHVNYPPVSLIVFAKDTVLSAPLSSITYPVTAGVYQLSGYISPITQQASTVTVSMTYKNKFGLPQAYTYSSAALTYDTPLLLRDFTASTGTLIIDVKYSGINKFGIGFTLRQVR